MLRSIAAVARGAGTMVWSTAAAARGAGATVDAMMLSTAGATASPSTRCCASATLLALPWDDMWPPRDCGVGNFLGHLVHWYFPSESDAGGGTPLTGGCEEPPSCLTGPWNRQFFGSMHGAGTLRRRCREDAGRPTTPSWCGGIGC